MKILMLTPYLPYPLLSGGQIRTYNLLKNLKDHHEITLFSLIKDDGERQYLPQLKKFCKKVVLLKRTKNPWSPRNILLAGLTAYPFLVTRNMPIRASHIIEQELKNDQYDLIHAETFYMMPNIPKTKTPILLVEQTIEYLGYQSYAHNVKFWPIKPLLSIDIAKIKRWETYFWQQASKLVTMSADDKVFIQKEVGKKLNIAVVANGVDMEFFNSVKKLNPQQPTVLFVGTFKWLPNADAVEFLVEQIWPKIIAKIPGAKLHIVGFSPSKKILAYGQQDSITVSGGIEDIRDAYRQAHVLLAPVRSGKGTRYKVLEAMAMGLPVVGTSLSVEGLDVRPGQDALVAETAEGLATKTIKILQDKKLQNKLAQNGKRLVSSRYDWTVISRELDRIYQELGKKK
ncbi:glycosyltransferase [Candidatus Beckwithbacteria bacterium]|nr:glycosyltransferase [Candidatus Beckwithbacteria bacterium]